METTSSTPKITEYKVIPVAGRDSMLLNIGGAHAPFFTRNILILKDSSGNIGVGEAPGGETIKRSLEQAKPFIEGQTIGKLRSLVSAVSRQGQQADFEDFGSGSWTFELRKRCTNPAAAA